LGFFVGGVGVAVRAIGGGPPAATAVRASTGVGVLAALGDAMGAALDDAVAAAPDDAMGAAGSGGVGAESAALGAVAARLSDASSRGDIRATMSSAATPITLATAAMIATITSVVLPDSRGVLRAAPASLT
jgi:hypothetical protein